MAVVHGRTGNHFLDSLSVENFNLLSPSLVEVVLTRDAVLCVPGLDIECVWFPTTGILSVVTILADGQDVEACTIGHESAYGLLNALGSPVAIDRVIAQVPGAAIKLAASRLRAAAALSIHITDLIVRHAQANAAQIQQSVACNAIHSVEARLCRWLLMTQDRTRSNRLPLTQEFLGFMLGVQRTTVTGVARGLQAEGSISYSRGLIEILDRAALQRGACECYASVLNKHAQLLGARPFNVSDPFDSTHVTARKERKIVTGA
jgi:CRP-like cAMP-binding protein